MAALVVPAGASVATMPRMPRVSRNVAIGGAVVLLHVAAVWGLNSGLLRRAVEVIVPIEMLSTVITPPAPKLEPTPVPPPPVPAPAPKQAAQPKPRAPAPAPAPRPVATPSPAPSPNAPTAVAEPQPAPPPITAPVAVAPAPAPAPATAPAPAAPPRIELPSSDAAYLQNPAPPYPPLSRRFGEQGRVVLDVLIGADGTAKDAKVKRSSGFERLDRIALETVRNRWRFVPGKRNGVAEDMWFDVPVNFELTRKEQ